MSSTSSIGSSGSGANFSFDGIVSGLNTSQIVDQLVAIESRPMLFTQQRQKQFQDQITSITNLTAKLSTASSAAFDLKGDTGWTPVKASTSDASVATATGTSAATVGSVTFTIGSLAHQSTFLSSSGVADATTAGVFTGSLHLSVGSGTSTAIDIGDGSLNAVINGINNAGVGITATSVKDGSNYRLQLVANTPGAGNDIHITPSEIPAGLGTMTQLYAASSASITLGSGPSAVTITSSTNQVDGLLPGVSISLLKEGGTVTIGATRDAESVAKKVQAMVDAVNGYMAEMRTQTKYDQASNKAGPLLGISAVRETTDTIHQAITNAIGSHTPNEVGIGLDKQGNMTFDTAAFTAAYLADPSSVSAMFKADSTTPGIAGRLYDAINNATNSADGLLTSVKNGTQSIVDDLQLSIDGMQTRLDTYRETLRRQFSSLETSLNQLKSQGSWLSSQLG